MGLRSTVGLSVPALLGCGGRSGLFGFESSGERAPTAGSDSPTAGGASGLADHEHNSSRGGALARGCTSAAGASTVAGDNSRGGTETNGGSGPSGAWLTLHHRDPPPPQENPFDWVGSPEAFLDVWSDDPSRALVIVLTPGYKGHRAIGLRAACSSIAGRA